VSWAATKNRKVERELRVKHRLAEWKKEEAAAKVRLAKDKALRAEKVLQEKEKKEKENRVLGAEITAVAKKWELLAKETGPADIEKARPLFTALYKLFKLPEPRIIPARSPLHANELLLEERRKGDVENLDLNVGRDHIREPSRVYFNRSRYTNHFTNRIVQALQQQRLSTVQPIRFSTDISWQFPRGNQELFMYTWEFLLRNDDKYGFSKPIHGYRRFSSTCRLARVVNISIQLARLVGYWTPYRDFVIVQDRPKRIHFNELELLHNVTGAAVEYSDGFGLYFMHDTAVPKWLATSTSSQLDPLDIVRLKNTQVRTEFIRKIGAERMLAKLGSKLLSKRNDYELHEVQIPGHWRTTRFLKMLNPSVPELWHVECVPANLATVEAALKWRKPLELQAIRVDDKRGQKWYQQGDVCIWPKGAKSVKSQPTILT